MRESGTATLPLARHAALHAPRAGRFALVGAIGVIVNTLVLFTLGVAGNGAWTGMGRMGAYRSPIRPDPIPAKDISAVAPIPTMMR